MAHFKYVFFLNNGDLMVMLSQVSNKFLREPSSDSVNIVKRNFVRRFSSLFIYCCMYRTPNEYFKVRKCFNGWLVHRKNFRELMPPALVDYTMMKLLKTPSKYDQCLDARSWLLSDMVKTHEDSFRCCKRACFSPWCRKINYIPRFQDIKYLAGCSKSLISFPQLFAVILWVICTIKQQI